MKLIVTTASILEEINQKFEKINQKTETHLEGLLWSKPITYWDYIQTNALLNLQIQRSKAITGSDWE
jgi:tryptophan 2,3-dioxygenase